MVRINPRCIFSTVVIVCALCAGICSYSTAEPLGAVSVSGSAHLYGQPDHSGILVVFEALTPTAVSDSALTDSGGSFDLLLQTGMYDVEYRKAGYASEYLDDQVISGETVLGDKMLYSISQLLEGDISGTLTSGEYYVDGNVNVPSGDTLIIEPGAVINFRGYYDFNVSGLLLAQGVPGDSIVFTSYEPAPAPGDWGTIYFDDQADDNSVMDYCRIEYAERGIDIENASPAISNCYIENHTDHGIYCGYSNSEITHCRVENCGYYGIYCSGASPSVTLCSIDYCFRGIYLYAASDPTVDRCVIRFCSSHGMNIQYTSGGTVSRCSFYLNLDGITTNYSGTDITECIFRSNESTGITMADPTPFTISRCLFYDEHQALMMGANNVTANITSNIVMACTTAVYFYASGTY